jgi:hypothetical protein
MEPLEEVWIQITNTTTNPDVSPGVSAIALAVQMFIGGVLSLHVRFLFRRCSVTASSTDSISRVFPLLTIITTAVIAVLKPSLTLALGLVGALSIVRFRAAIKEPEELIYLFLCIALGLALGASQPLGAVALVVIATVFIYGMHHFGTSRREQNILLTISGEASRHFSDNDSEVLEAVQQVAGRYVLQRYDVENNRGQVRLVLPPTNEDRTREIISQLRDRLPDCEMSYVNLSSMI